MSLAEYRPDDVAVTGIAGEFPEAPNIESLWSFIKVKGLAVTSFDEQRRWPRDANTGYCRHAAFIDNAYKFDAGFFSIAPVQALYLDPQERRLLQTAYMALENSGYFQKPHGNVGVYTAAMYPHYMDLTPDKVHFSTSFAQIGNRISHRLDLHGPSICIDTMCSGSLVALHLAVTALRAGECQVALVGAANIHVHPGKFRLLCQGGYLSPTGRCHTFGSQADGYLAGEGSIAVTLKTLSHAMNDGDPIWGVIRATAVGSDGGEGGFTVPNAQAQARVIQRAMKMGGVTPNQISYIECHGTGTPVGDPVEVEGLALAYSQDERSDIQIGSIKTNIGHLEAAAGLAGLVKVLLQMQHQQLIPGTGSVEPNPALKLSERGFEVSGLQEWSGMRLAGINSFGAGGTNAHAIIQTPPQNIHPTKFPPGPYLIPLSAHTPKSLQMQVSSLCEWMDTHNNVDLYSIGYTLALAREHQRYRICICADHPTTFKHILKKITEDGYEHTLQFFDYGERTEDIKSWLNGDTFHWGRLYPIKYLTELPSYPFEGRVFDAFNSNENNSKKFFLPNSRAESKPEITQSHSGLLTWQHIEGTGPTILLLAPTNVSRNAWHCQTEFFRRKGFNILLPAYPGHDGNGHPDFSFKIEDIAADIGTYLRKIDTGPVHCVGWSLGALIALSLAWNHNDVLKNLTLIGGSARFRNSITDMLTAFNKEILNWDSFISFQLQGDFDARKSLLSGADNKSIFVYYNLLRDFDMESVLTKLMIPALIVQGKDDNCITDEEVKILGSIPEARVVELQGGHLLPITASFKINQLLLEHFV